MGARVIQIRSAACRVIQRCGLAPRSLSRAPPESRLAIALAPRMACRLLYYTSLAFGEAASLAVEMAAARQGNVHGYALCSMATDAAFAEVTRVEEGGSQFEEGTERFVGNASDYKQAPFFATARAFGVDAVEHATIHDVLSTDARFAVRANLPPRRARARACSPPG